MSPWRPLFDRLKKEHSEDTLHEGIPDHMWSSLIGWLQTAVFESPLMSTRPQPSTQKLQEIERTCRIPLEWEQGPRGAWRSLLQQMVDDHELALEVVNRVLSWVSGSYPNRTERQHILEAVSIFEDSGSAWKVAIDDDGDMCLQQRVSQEISDRYESVTRRAGERASEHLRIAWYELYGREPDPTEAYEHAVKAVEAAARPVLAPDDENATLTKMTANLRDAQHKWSVEMASDAKHTTGVDAVHAMMDALGKGQHTRHGKPDPTQPKDASPDEGEAALHVAITLVHWFDAGLIKPAEQDPL